MFLQKKLIFSCFLFCILIIVIFSISELCLRIFLNSKKTPESFKYVQKIGYYNYPPMSKLVFYNEEGKKIIIETDEFGLRNTPGMLSTSEIIILGDSFISTTNTSQDQTFVEHLRNYGYKVYNAGMDGFSTFNEYYLLLDLLKIAKPKIVILTFYLGNDFRDNYFGSFISLNSSIDIKTTFKLKSFALSILDKSATLKFIYVHIYQGLIKGYSKNPMASYGLSEMISYYNKTDPAFEIAINKTQEVLNQFNALSKEKGFTFIILGLPSKAQVTQSFREIGDFFRENRSYDFSLNTIENGYSFDQPDIVLRNLSEKSEIKYFSILPLFRQNPREKLYYCVDVHWTNTGQKLAADFLQFNLSKK